MVPPFFEGVAIAAVQGATAPQSLLGAAVAATRMIQATQLLFEVAVAVQIFS